MAITARQQIIEATNLAAFSFTVSGNLPILIFYTLRAEVNLIYILSFLKDFSFQYFF
jgi:hypothetical protein